MAMTGANQDVATALARGEINLAGVAKVVSLMGQAGAISMPLPSTNRFVDLQYLRAAGIQ